MDGKTSMVARPPRFHELIRALDRHAVFRRRSSPGDLAAATTWRSTRKRFVKAQVTTSRWAFFSSRSPSGVSDRRPAETGKCQQLSLAFRCYPDEYQHALAGVSRRASKRTPSSHRYPCCSPDRRRLSRMSPSLACPFGQVLCAPPAADLARHSTIHTAPGNLAFLRPLLSPASVSRPFTEHRGKYILWRGRDTGFFRSMAWSCCTAYLPLNKVDDSGRTIESMTVFFFLTYNHFEDDCESLSLERRRC